MKAKLRIHFTRSAITLLGLGVMALLQGCNTPNGNDFIKAEWIINSRHFLDEANYYTKTSQREMHISIQKEGEDTILRQYYGTCIRDDHFVGIIFSGSDTFRIHSTFGNEMEGFYHFDSPPTMSHSCKSQEFDPPYMTDYFVRNGKLVFRPFVIPTKPPPSQRR